MKVWKIIFLSKWLICRFQPFHHLLIHLTCLHQQITSKSITRSLCWSICTFGLQDCQLVGLLHLLMRTATQLTRNKNVGATLASPSHQGIRACMPLKMHTPRCIQRCLQENQRWCQGVPIFLWLHPGKVRARPLKMMLGRGSFPFGMVNFFGGPFG